MNEQRFQEDDRVFLDFNNGGQMERREGTVVQASETQPHIAWIDWDDGRRWQLTGTAHLHKIEEHHAS